MTRERDKFPRLRAKPGRIGRADLVRQDLMLAGDELDRALEAPDVRTMRERITLARRFLLAATEKLRRLS